MSLPNFRTQAQVDASRINGAQSRGPVTAAGKQTSSHNRLVHGFRSSSITLSSEDKPAYDTHLEAYLAKYRPEDKMQEDLVGLAASSMWNYMRLCATETRLLEISIGAISEDSKTKNRKLTNTPASPSPSAAPLAPTPSPSSSATRPAPSARSIAPSKPSTKS